MAAEPIEVGDLRPEVDLDRLATGFRARADTLPLEALPALDAEIRDWLARLEYRDPALVPMDVDADAWFRRYRGRLLHALGLSALRVGDLRQAEAALRSAVAEIHNRGTTTGYADPLYHLGDVLAERRRWREAAEAYLAAEIRGMGAAATPALEAAWRRSRGSTRGLEAARSAERARVEDERRQLVVAAILEDPLPPFSWHRRDGPALDRAALTGVPTVLAFWGPGCCPDWPVALSPLADRLSTRGARLIGVWLGGDAPPGATAGLPVAIPADPAAVRRRLSLGRLPVLLVVDAAARIRYRHAGVAARPLPSDDVILQVDHLERRRGHSSAPPVDPGRESR